MQEEYLNMMEDILKEYFPKYLESLKQLPRKAIHLNTSLLEQKDILNSLLKEPIPFDENSYFIDEEKPGLNIFHTLGLYYVQEPSAMMPVLATSIPTDAKILDLCASPGGKTLQLANIASEGIIYANEINSQRSKKLVSNIERLGLRNVVVTNMNSEELKKTFQGYFDIILVDAPCSLEGTFRKDPLAITLWSKKRVLEMASLQKQIASDACEMLKPHGKLIYSTCTFSKEENEEVVKYLMEKESLTLKNVNKRLVPFTKDGLEPFEKTRRCCPFLIGEGQYLAVLEKNEGTSNPITNILEPLQLQDEKIILPQLLKTLTSIPFTLYKYHSQIIAVPHKKHEVPNLKTYSCFVKLGEIQKGRVIFHHQFARSYGKYFKRQVELENDPKLLNQYLMGLEIYKETEDGWGVITVHGYPLGLYKASQNKLKNHYPKGLRN